jgi:predicted nucleotidyltransferase
LATRNRREDMTRPAASTALPKAPPHMGWAVGELLGEKRVRALCVFGSMARGKWDAGSDLDLLAVVPTESDASEVRTHIRTSRLKDSAQVRLMTVKALERNLDDMTVFAAHLAREGKVISDRDGRITALLDEYPKDAPVRENARSLASQLAVYEQLDWCANHYLFCLSDLYAWGRAAAMLVLAREGAFEFDRERVFQRLGELHPNLAESAEQVRDLRPFWLLVRRRQRVDLPFPPTGSHRETAAARDACREIVHAGL